MKRNKMKRMIEDVSEFMTLETVRNLREIQEHRAAMEESIDNLVDKLAKRRWLDMAHPMPKKGAR